MRSFTSLWRDIFRRPDSKKVVLVTVISGRRGWIPGEHLARVPAARRYGTELALVDDGSDQYPFWPVIVEWPDIVFRFSPEERRAELTQATVRLSALADFPHDELDTALPTGCTARVDLWSPGISLDEVFPLLQGPLVGADSERRSGGITLSIQDGDPEADVDLERGALTAVDFPNAPETILNKAKRQSLFGPFPHPIPCHQIDQDGKEFYLCDPPVTVAPAHTQVGGMDVTADLKAAVSEGTFLSDPYQRRYTKLTFPRPVQEIGIFGTVSVSGGVGLATNSPARLLLEDPGYGGYELSDQAKIDLAAVDKKFDFSVFTNATTSILSFVGDRLLPQTNVVMGFRMGRIHTYRLLEKGNDTEVAVGAGLIYRIHKRTSITRVQDVFNVIEVQYSRNILPLANQEAGQRNVFVLDKNYAGDIGALLASSQKIYGRRSLTLEAPDLVYEGRGIGGHPLGVIVLAETTAQLVASPHKQYTYLASWEVGMAMDINARRLLTDDDESLSVAPVRVVEWIPTALGPVVTFQTEDLAI